MMLRVILLLTITISLFTFTTSSQHSVVDDDSDDMVDSPGDLVEVNMDTKSLNSITIGGGCFWCMEAMFQRLRGVERVQPGYAGGSLHNPTYPQVKSGSTGHAQVAVIHFDPSIISYQTLLYIFMHIHNPTTPNRQGQDIGPQYRSIILYQKGSLLEQQVIKSVLSQVQRENQYPGSPEPIVTQVKQLQIFYPSEDYHHNYYNSNPEQEYCESAIAPKLGKLKKLFKDYIDESKY